MPGSMPATSQPDWLISMTAMIVLFWSRATRDLLKSFGWGIAALHRLHAATKFPFPRRPPHSVSWSLRRRTSVVDPRFDRPYLLVCAKEKRNSAQEYLRRADRGADRSAGGSQRPAG